MISTIKTSTKLVLYAISALFLISFIISLVPNSAKAVSASDWKPGRIIDDAVFFNKDAMNPLQIQAFLNSKVPVCDTWHNWSGTVNGVWNAPPYTCLKDYSENGKSSAQIIWEASQNHGINPQVLIATLQKETAIVTDTWAAPWQYQRAMGYACPDTAACNSQYYGFTNQVHTAAWQLKRYTLYPDSYNFKSGVTRNIQWHPNAGCGSSPVYIETKGTAALYNYTPYQPNGAALNNMYGTGDGCSAYGNRNFWRIFNDWFGSTLGGPNYTWDIVSYTYEGGDNTISINTTEKVTLKAKNTGKLPWYNHGNHPIRLGTWGPADHKSALINNGIRYATLTENSVQPGEIGTFEYNIKSSQIGTFVEAMNIVADNSEWSAWPGFSPSVVVNNGNSWKIDNVIYEKGTGLMDPGSTQLITVIAKNTGTTTWSKTSGPKIRMGTWEPGRESAVSQNWLSKTRATDMNETTVAPGQNAGFQFYVKMPNSGTCYEKLNLVADGQEWFNNQGLTLYLQGKNFAWQPLWHSHSTGTANIPRNTEFTLTVKVKNTGALPWSKNSGPPIRLATVEPLDRGSALYTSSWIRDTRPASLIEDNVNPGEEGTFIFTARTPNVPGSRVERFSVVAEGYTWLNDPGFNIYVNVL